METFDEALVAASTPQVDTSHGMAELFTELCLFLFMIQVICSLVYLFHYVESMVYQFIFCHWWL